MDVIVFDRKKGENLGQCINRTRCVLEKNLFVLEDCYAKGDFFKEIYYRWDFGSAGVVYSIGGVKIKQRLRRVKKSNISYLRFHKCDNENVLFLEGFKNKGLYDKLLKELV